MKYWLRHIAQSSWMSRIVLIGLGAAMWVPSFFALDSLWALVATLVLVAVNAFMMMRIFYQANVTNLPSFFVPTSYWLLCSALPFLHTCWQGQVAVLSAQLTYLILLRIDYQHQPLQEAFLSTLILCCASLLVHEILIIIPGIWLYMLYRHVITWRVLAASLIGIGTFALYYAIAIFLGWTDLADADWFALSHLPAWLTVLQMILTAIIIYLPVRFADVFSGIIYMVSVIVAIAVCILLQTLSLANHTIPLLISG